MTLFGLTVIQPTQHWFRRDGSWYREVWVRDCNGLVRLVGIDAQIADTL